MSRVARAVMRLWLPIKERKQTKALDQALTTFKDLAVKFETGQYFATSTIINIGLYFLIAERDIQSLKIDALTHPDEWRRKLCIRVILLTLHELDADKVSGLELKRALDFVGVADELKVEATQALRVIRSVHEKIEKKVGSLRNTAIAHRDRNALVQYRSMENLEKDEALAIASEYYFGVRRLIDVLPKLLVQASAPESLLRQLVHSEREK